ncbi:MAG TPA: hypothetical protein VIM58_03015, partial [Candidatus Methylacidiphilales bacterium]
LDANVAGYPVTGTAPVAGRKGTAAFADLTQIGLTQPQIDLLAGWRNYATAQPGGSLKAGFTFPSAAALRYANAMATNSGGFTSVSTNVWNGRTDSAFVSRQALIGFFLTNGLPQDSLQYLATFTQGRNAPSWGPEYNAAALNGTAAYAYRDLANTAGQANRFLPNVRFPSKTTLTTYALDGSISTRTVDAGSSVVQRRFSLSRIAWIAYNGPSQSMAHPENAAKAIQHHFGLVWDATNFRWIYTSPDGNAAATSIKTLDLVAKQGREPDFFELLQAVILGGSLGKDAGAVGTTTTYGPSGDTQAYDQTRAYQILQIGANIIDQAQAESFPTDIHTDIGPMAGGTDVYGSVDLPQLARVFFCSSRYASNDQRVGGWFVPEVWNPYQPAANAALPGPAVFRFVGTGSAYLQVSGQTASTLTSPTANLSSQGYVSFASVTVPAAEPTLLTPANATPSTAANAVTGPTMSDPNSTASPKYSISAPSLAGIWIGDAPANCAYDPASPSTDRNFSAVYPQGANFFLQYSNSVTGGWSTYAVMKQQKNSIRCGNIVDITNPVGSAAKNYFAYVQRVDPRCDRFGGSMAYQSYGGWMGKPNVTLRPTWAQPSGEILGQWPPSPAAGFTYTSASGGASGAAPFHNWAALGMLGENRPVPSFGTAAGTYNVYYSDPDGIVRRADGAFAARNQAYGLPL